MENELKFLMATLEFPNEYVISYDFGENRTDQIIIKRTKKPSLSNKSISRNNFVENVI